MNRWIPVLLCLLLPLAAGSAQARPHFRSFDDVRYINWGGATSSGPMRVRGLAAPTAMRRVVSPRDAASGMSTGKRQHAPTRSLSTRQRKRDAASGLPTGKRQHKPIIITKHVDKATPLLQRVHATKRSLPRVVLKGRDSSGRYLTFELYKVRITSYKVSGLGQTAMEQITLVFEKIERR